MGRRVRDRHKPVGGLPPFGARWAGPNGERYLEWIPALIPVVRDDIFVPWASGMMSQRAIARALEHAEVPTVNGGVWRQATVRCILKPQLHREEPPARRVLRRRA